MTVTRVGVAADGPERCSVRIKSCLVVSRDDARLSILAPVSGHWTHRRILRSVEPRALIAQEAPTYRTKSSNKSMEAKTQTPPRTYAPQATPLIVPGAKLRLTTTPFFGGHDRRDSSASTS